MAGRAMTLRELPFIVHHGITTVASRCDRHLLKSRLTGLIREKVDRTVVRHGGLIEIDGRGLLIMGDSGRGKTTCALCLARRGARWIADDRVEIKKQGRQLIGRSPECIRGLVAVRECGVMSVESFLDGNTIATSAIIGGVVELIAPSPGHKRHLNPSRSETARILGVILPRFLIPVPAEGGRHCAWEDILEDGRHGSAFFPRSIPFSCPLKQPIREASSGGSE